jgi:hypothetical protein
LPNLTHIKLLGVLYKLPAENFSANDYIFPPNLYYLEIIKIVVIGYSSFSDPYKFLILGKDDDTVDMTFDFFELPKI